MIFTLLFSLLTFNAQANTNAVVACHQFQSNQVGYTQICVRLQDPNSENTNAMLDVYRGQTLVASLPAKRTRYPDVFCTFNQPNCYRSLNRFEIATTNSNANGVEAGISIYTYNPNQCRSGSLVIKNGSSPAIVLGLACGRGGWSDRSND